MSGTTRVALISAALATTLAGCGGDGLTDTEREAYGVYTLTAVNGLPLPFTLARPCGERLERGYMELGRQNRFYVDVEIYNPGCPEEADDDPHSWTGTGIWTVIDGNVRLVNDVGAQQYVVFGTTPAPFDGTDVDATAMLEVVGYEGNPVRPSLRPVQMTLTFTMNE